MKEMTWNDTQALEAIRANINELINDIEIAPSINYLDLCAMMVIGGYCVDIHPVEHNNVASVSNFLSIPYEMSLGILDHLVSYGYVQGNGNDNKLTDKGLDFTRRYVGDNRFNVFRQRMFEAINLTLYPKPNSDDVIEPYNSLTNIEIGNNNCGKQLYDKILELPCVWMCYVKLQTPSKDCKDVSEVVFDITGKRLVKKDRNKEISRIIQNIVNKTIMLPENERCQYIEDDDLKHLLRSDFNNLTSVNGETIKIEDPFREAKDKAYQEWLETEDGSRYK